MKGEAVITLLTDFGTADHYVASMKAVLACRTRAAVVDITHEIPPQDVAEAAYQLACCHRYFPRGSVHVVVVDPGVGGGRRIVAVRSGGMTYLAPDNGVLDMALAGGRIDGAVEVTDRRFFLDEVSCTFHGRDIFAPVAAAVFEGTPLSELGGPAGPLVRLARPEVRLEGDTMVGHIIHIDRFGNLVSDIGRGSLGLRKVGEVRLSGRVIPFGATYCDVAEGEAVAYFGSAGLLEVAVRNGSAARTLRSGVGDPIAVRLA